MTVAWRKGAQKSDNGQVSKWWGKKGKPLAGLEDV